MANLDYGHTKIDCNRRDFFRYAAGGAVAAGTMTYSSDSHAIVITAAAIAAGEKIGWAAKPFLDLGEMTLSELYDMFIKEMTSMFSKGATQAIDMVPNAMQQIFNNDYLHRIQPLSDPCSYNSLAHVGVKRLIQSENLARELNRQGVLSTKPLGECLPTYACSFIDSQRTEPMDEQEYLGLRDQFQRINTPQQKLESFTLDYLRVCQSAKRTLNTAILNYEMSRIYTNRHIDSFEKIRSTYQSEKWRTSMNETAADISLAQEVIYQKSSSVQIMFELLVAEQNLLVAECIDALSTKKEIQE
ncbi:MULTISPECIES: hypothetical protein [Vibrio]|uniref:Uncharacterized protein n=1 Tax=Vibrio tasmaniensis TaxID=212663 RepID=A0A2N7NCL5_9VIBR|nr:hypothetical protein [Vibrio tasmaniensis]PMO89868.1 hypothetical protein BCT01_00885 [Vibrio tasmaniensis]PMP09960.1 hypothetical protein BCS92_02205 [Vibrio tasmaniensis]TKG27973.1 hypothetical protein FC057_22560 [Vibrio tasmaniensis]TKG40542.1 hypothetical protein FC060_23825 [Vibrio tasmaniensis]TKG41662.1 hypothetical protein FC063_07310 [Vibrio tasmaniensis]